MPDPIESPEGGSPTESTTEPKKSFFSKKLMALVVGTAAVLGSEEFGLTDWTPIGRDVPAASPEGEEEVVPMTPLEVKKALGPSIEVIQDGCAWDLRKEHEKTPEGRYTYGPALNFVIARDEQGLLDEVRIDVGEPIKDLQVTFINDEGVLLRWKPKSELVQPNRKAPADEVAGTPPADKVAGTPLNEVAVIPKGVSLAIAGERFSSSGAPQLDMKFRAIVEYETASGAVGRAALQYGDDKGMQNLKRYELRGLKGPSEGERVKHAGPDGQIQCKISDSGELVGMTFIGMDPLISKASILVSGETHRGFEDFGQQSQELLDVAVLSLVTDSSSDRSVDFDIRSICQGKRIYRDTNAVILLETTYGGESQLFTLKPFQ